uniref:Secreted protein n=1 Tax=Mycobacterium phage BabyBack TaxID=3158877 RepID=A0AAU8GQU7_9CAUD
MKSYFITISIAFVTAITVLTFADDDKASATVPFTQAAFPCEEDEVLGYAPQFGPDNVGCIHVDLIKR